MNTILLLAVYLQPVVDVSNICLYFCPSSFSCMFVFCIASQWQCFIVVMQMLHLAGCNIHMTISLLFGFFY